MYLDRNVTAQIYHFQVSFQPSRVRKKGGMSTSCFTPRCITLLCPCNVVFDPFELSPTREMANQQLMLLPLHSIGMESH